ncbi:alpha/beta fold hydrolase [Mucilaginibacter arboris]|uniref:Alpha/beta fold hydrolase n=1 Tax=Mucilaginibacter arboris TaxID=2682090 RepID=A0A7K1T1K5_9SPHI|nr:alpha/beta hydrolase [Mucilaginibacter arboris]MVN23160.1 alpha/beta fold hydrolase [Mucilaginibacter arboris]
MEISSRFYEVNGIYLHAAVAGPPKGKVILFLHGFPEFSLGWKKQLLFFAEKGYYAIAPDQRGYNFSSKPKGVKAYRIENLVADVVELIQQLSTQKVILVGHDWGGAVAWEVAGRYPELIEKLIILNMPHLKVMRDTLKRNFRQLLKSWYTGFFQVPFLPEWFSSLFNYKILEQSMVRSANKKTFSNQELAQYKSAWRNPGALKAMINWYRAYKYSKPALKKISIPTLILWGKKDKFLLPQMAEKSNLLCARGKLIMLEDATHWLHHEKAAKVNRLILNFLF